MGEPECIKKIIPRVLAIIIRRSEFANKTEIERSHLSIAQIERDYTNSNKE